MRQTQHTLLAFSFFWIGLWAIMGSLLAAQLNLALLRENVGYLASVQRELLRSAHAHMNIMSIVVAVVAFCLPKIVRVENLKVIQKMALWFPPSVVLFGCGIVGEAFYPTSVKGISVFTVFSAVGGTVFLFLCFAFSALLWARRKS